jgi:DNA invertase Pin-like site-specific DNA recombinase
MLTSCLDVLAPTYSSIPLDFLSEAFTHSISNDAMIQREHRAAQYVRMSTDMQEHSIKNQVDAIALYAARRGLTIVRTYEDAGRSGLRLDGRPALEELIGDVRLGRADFSVVLVYDVSRWGRFQDTDESAHYEFICRQAGVSIEYCAEQFANDGSLTATVIKNIKRAMAGEYSRELSVKVHAGQCRIAAMGFRRGGPAVYGLRRCLVDSKGKRKGKLSFGQWKSITTDRVILVPGPPHEIKTVNRIYRMFVEKGMLLNDIAYCLNTEGIENAQGRPWQPSGVRDLLKNESYVGNNIFNRTSVALKGKWRRNHPSKWIRVKGAFEPIVSQDLFDRAQKILKENLSYTPNELLDFLSAIWCRYGTISVETVSACKSAPGPQAYQRCFGGLMPAYLLLGFQKPRLKNWARNQNFRTAMNREIIEGVKRHGGSARLLPGGYMLHVNDEITLGTSVVRLVINEYGDRRWNLGYKTRTRPDILIVARAEEGQDQLLDYFVLPYLLIGRNWLTFSEGDSARVDPFEMASLSPLLELLGRVPIQPSLPEFDALPRMTCGESTAFERGIAWPSADVERSISGNINSLRIMLADQSFADLMCAHGIRSMPRPLAPVETGQAPRERDYGQSMLDFAVVWTFVSKLMSYPRICSRINDAWPQFQGDMKMTYLSVLTKGPLARLPWAFARSQRPICEAPASPSASSVHSKGVLDCQP